ncbi:DUF6975 family protein [Sphingomonas sp. ID0503]|uniref:DUF6975 family protein n=1 Tax=Sphingomonas sp. ID0503 TaxID=3399691 RepID=UPI003AFB1DB9
MTPSVVPMATVGGLAERLPSLAAAEGTAAHDYPAELVESRRPESMGDLADAAHYLCVVHGRNPGVVDFARDRTIHPGAGPWLDDAAAAFAAERTYLAQIVVAAGPLPSTPGQAETEAAVLGQRHALEMLAKSDRDGCALGAAMALTLDWWAVRRVLDAAAGRLDIPVPLCRLPSAGYTRDLARELGTMRAVERAVAFGAQQILLQHHGLWDLLEARHLARLRTN